MPQKIYLASTRYDVSIMEVEVEKETDKQYKVNGETAKTVYGKRSQYVGRVVFKERGGVCLTLREAQEWCLDSLKRRLESLMRQLNETNGGIADLITAMGATDAGQDQP